MASADPERRDEVESGEVVGGEEEDTGAQIAPIIRLEEVAVTTGEEEEDVLLDLKARLYRFDKEGNQWKERGTGSVKLLKHRETGKVRLVMRQVKTLKICANHLVIPSIKVQEHVGNDKSCVWHAADFSDGELKEEMFCIRFGSIENCKKFKEMIEGVAESLGKNEERENKDVSATAGLVEKLSVGESTSEVASVASAPAETAEPASTADAKKDETEAEERTDSQA